MKLINGTSICRWPEAWQEDKYFKLNNDKFTRDTDSPVRKKQPDFFFPLLEEVRLNVLRRILICSSLELKPVKRYPTWILSYTYNLKNKPVDFS